MRIFPVLIVLTLAFAFSYGWGDFYQSKCAGCYGGYAYSSFSTADYGSDYGYYDYSSRRSGDSYYGYSGRDFGYFGSPYTSVSAYRDPYYGRGQWGGHYAYGPRVKTGVCFGYWC